MTGTGAALVAAAETQLGKPYALPACRCDEGCYARDCSGLCVYSIRTGGGINCPCTSSFGLAQWGNAAGTLIGEAEALITPGTLAIRNAFGSPNGPSGSNGHVVVLKGDGVSTVEAMGRAYGIVRGRASGRGFDAWMKVPGVDYSPPVVVDWSAVKRMAEWKKRVSDRPLHLGDKRPLDNQMLNFLLVLGGWTVAPSRMDHYTLVTAGGVLNLKRTNNFPQQDGKVFGSKAATALLAPK